MLSVDKRYEKIIEQIFVRALQLSQKQKISEKAVKQIYESFGKNQILKQSQKINIVMDNQFGQAIQKFLKTLVSKYGNDFKNLERRIKFLTYLAAHLKQVKFITTRQYNKIEQDAKKIQSTKQYKLNNRLLVLSKSHSKEDFREQLFSIIFENSPDIDYEDDDEVKKLYQTFYENAITSLDRKLLIKLDSILSKFQKRHEIFSSNFLDKLDAQLGQQIGKDDFEIEANKKLISIAENQTLSSNQQNVQILNQQYEEIKKILNKFSGLKLFGENLKLELHLSKFGSIISGFATRNTDMDLTILTNCYINQIQLLEYLASFIKAEFKYKKMNKYDLKVVKTARIPVLTLAIPSRNNNEVYIDIIVNNILGVINSKFLAVYASVNWIRQLGILIKVWGKCQKLIQQKLFSSYSLNLMLIHFLYETKRIQLIMDARQRNIDKTPHFMYKRRLKDEQQSFPVFFQFKTNKSDVTHLKRVNIYQVLLEFFEYYGQNGKHWKLSKQNSIITVDGSKDKKFDQSFLFVIRDPFDERHNPGRVPVGQKQKFLSTIRGAVQKMQSRSIDQLQNLFE